MFQTGRVAWMPANGLLLSIFEHPGIPNHLIAASRLDVGVALWTVSNCSARFQNLQVTQLGVLNWISDQSKVTITTTQLNNETTLSVECDTSSHVQAIRLVRCPWRADLSVKKPLSQDVVLTQEWLPELGFDRFNLSHRNWSIRGESFGSMEIRFGDSSPNLRLQIDSAHPCYDVVLRRLYYGVTVHSLPFLQVWPLDSASTPFTISAPDQLAYVAVSPNAERVFALGRLSGNLFIYHVDTKTWYPPVVLDSLITRLAVMSDNSGIWVATDNSLQFHATDYGFGTSPPLNLSNGEL